MEPPDGCPPEVYDIMRQVDNILHFSYITYLIVKRVLLDDVYSLIGMGFTARKETKFPRYKSDTRPIESRVHQRRELRRNLMRFK